MNLRHLLAALLLLPPAAPAATQPEAYSGLPQSAYRKMDAPGIETMGSDRLRLRLDDELLDYQANSFRVHSNGDRSFVATALQGSSTAHITQGASGTFGGFYQNGKHWQLTTDRNGTWLVELPATGVSYNSCGTMHELMGSNSISGEKDAPGPKFSEIEPDPDLSAAQARTNQAPGTVIDLLVIYNQAMRDRYPGDLLQTRINHLVDIANQTTANSEIDLGFRLVGLEFFDYRDDNSNVELLNDMATALNGTNPAGLEGLGNLRSSLGADLVIMFRPHEIEIRGNCGVAFFPNNNPALGVNVVSDGMSSWSACLDDVMIHEIGHNLGAAHQAGFGGGAFDMRGAAFVRPGQFNTVMGSFGTGRPDRFRGLPVFSSPHITCGGLSCGNPSNTDNATIIREVMPLVAAYRADRNAAPLPDTLPRSQADTDGDGVIDWLDHFPFDPTEQGDNDGDAIGDNTDAFPLDAGEQFDSDGDGVGNLADSDDDGDGVSDPEDAFPVDASETEDPDLDGVGSNADAFPSDAGEFRDFDGDGTGNNADDDDDGDGLPELDALAEDILVISTGNSRILRFDAATGAPRGIEVPPADGLVTFQSDLAYRPSDHTLMYLSDSSIRRVDLLNRHRLGTWVPAYNDADPSAAQLLTGFPTALETPFTGGRVAATRMQNAPVSLFFGQEQPRTDTILNWAINNNDSPIDLVAFEDGAIVLGQTNRTLYRTTGQGTFILSGPGANWMRDPRRMVLSPDNRLFIADPGRNAVVEVDTITGDFLGEFTDLAALGYRKPTSVAVTAAGELLVASEAKNAILAFDIETGDFLGVRVPSRSAGLSKPHAMIVVPALLDRRGDDPTRVIRPNPGLWYNPVTNGRGFDIQVFGNRLTAIWYTYGGPPLGSPIWFFSSGVLDGFEYHGALLFGSLDDQGQASFEEVGELRIVFNSERQAEMSFVLGELEGGEPIQWLAFDHDPAPSDYTGLWGREDGPGWGISLATQGDHHVAVAYVFNSNGRPRWLISDAARGTAPLNFTMNATSSMSLCPGCSGEPEFEINQVGTMEILTGPGGYWSSAIGPDEPAPIIPEFPPITWHLDKVPIVLFSDPPEPPR